MLQRITGIVTDIIRHNDSNNVVTLYTRQLGRMAFLVPVGKSKSGRMRNSCLLPMAVLEADVNIRPGKELYPLRQVAPVRLWHDIYSNPLKSSLVFFLTEFCSRLLRQYPADGLLWDFIVEALEYLETIPPRRIANFHLAFLIRMMAITGIEPSASSWTQDEQFDMLSGEMTGLNPPDFLRRRILLPQDESSKVPLLLRMNLRNMHLYRFTREERQRVLNRLLEYYSVHLSLNREYKSLDVLRDLFN